MQKRLESLAKIIKNRNRKIDISAIEPERYQKRFQQKLSEWVLKPAVEGDFDRDLWIQ